MNKNKFRYLYSGIQKTIERLGRSRTGTKVLMFHQVNNDEREWTDASICVSRDRFESFIERLLKCEYHFVPVCELEKNIINSRNVIVTFDDVFQDSIRNAVPYLVEKQIPFCVFISDCCVGKKGYVTLEEIEMLKQEPLCTIGYHTKNHLLMRSLDIEKTQLEINSKDFEREHDIAIQYFAYPYGSLFACSKQNRNVLKSSNYKLAFSTFSLECTYHWLRKRPYFLPRINVNESNIENITKRFCSENRHFFR